MLKFFSVLDSKEKAARNALKRSAEFDAALIESAGEGAIRIRGTDLDVTVRCDDAARGIESQGASVSRSGNLFDDAKLRPGVPLSFKEQRTLCYGPPSFWIRSTKCASSSVPFVERNKVSLSISACSSASNRNSRDKKRREAIRSLIGSWNVGKKKFAYLSDDLTGRWNYGDPIRLSLRWAGDSPTRPIPSAIPVPFMLKERTAVLVQR